MNDISTPDGLLEYLVCEIVTNQSAVRISTGLLRNEREIVLVLEVAPEDLPQVLGEYDDEVDGDTAFALEEIINAVFSRRLGLTFYLDIIGEPAEIRARRVTS